MCFAGLIKVLEGITQWAWLRGSGVGWEDHRELEGDPVIEVQGGRG